MCRLGFLWASLAIAGHGHTLHMLDEISPSGSYEEPSKSPLSSLATLLLTTNLAAGWQLPQAGRCCHPARDSARKSALARQTELYSLTGRSPVSNAGRLQHTRMEEAPGVKLENEPLEKLPIGLQPPGTYDEMLKQAETTTVRAILDGKDRLVLRLLLPDGDSLKAPDEGWAGGIIQLYGACSPVVRQLLRRVCFTLGGSEPKLSEQVVDDTEGVGLWNAVSVQPENDAVAMVQPMFDQMKDIRKLDFQAGPRPFLLVNPQWKETLDPFDGIAAEDGVVGAIGRYLGGKKDRNEDLNDMGFEEIYVISEYVSRGSRICLFKVYPYGWTAFYVDKKTQDWTVLMSGLTSRPSGQDVEQALIDAGVPFNFNEYTETV